METIDDEFQKYLGTNRNRDLFREQKEYLNNSDLILYTQFKPHEKIGKESEEYQNPVVYLYERFRHSEIKQNRKSELMDYY